MRNVSKRFRIEGYIAYRLIMASAAEAEALASAEREVETMEATQLSEEGKDEPLKADSPKDVNGTDEGEGEEEKKTEKKKEKKTDKTDKAEKKIPKMKKPSATLKRPSAAPSGTQKAKKIKGEEKEEEDEPEEKEDDKAEEGPEETEEPEVMKKPSAKAKPKAKDSKKDKKDKDTKDEKKDKKEKEKKTETGKDKKEKEKKTETGKDTKEKKDTRDKDAKAKSKAGKRDQERAAALVASDSGEESKDEKHETADAAGEEKRDAKKMYHFNKSLRLLPESVRKMFDSKEVSRADKTKLVNSVVEHTSDGKYVVNPDAPVIALLSKSYTNVVGEELLGFPFCFMFPLWKFCIPGFCFMFLFLFCTFFLWASLGIISFKLYMHVLGNVRASHVP